MSEMGRVLVGESGVSISRIGLGGYELGPEVEEVPDVARARRVFELALAAGINWVDTAESYLNAATSL